MEFRSEFQLEKTDDFALFYPIECDFLDIIVIEKSSAHDEIIVG